MAQCIGQGFLDATQHDFGSRRIIQAQPLFGIELHSESGNVGNQFSQGEVEIHRRILAHIADGITQVTKQHLCQGQRAFNLSQSVPGGFVRCYFQVEDQGRHLVAEQVVDACGDIAEALISRNVNEPSVPFPATFSSTLFEAGCFRSIALGLPLPENVILT